MVEPRKITPLIARTFGGEWVGDICMAAASKQKEGVSRATDNLAAQMIACGENEFRRTAKGDGRGLFCGMGICGECRVHVGEHGTIRACMSARSHTGDVSPHSPDVIPDASVADVIGIAEEILNPDVLIIGAGPAGLSTAKVCAREGLRVVILDERISAGGQYYKQPAESFFRRSRNAPDRQSRRGRVLIDQVRELGVEIISGAMVWGVESNKSCHALIGNASRVFRPKALVLATGAYERTYPFRGWVEPGVMTTGAIQTMLRSYGVLTGRRFVIAGNGPLNFQVASEVLAAGGEVVAVIEAAPLFSVRRVLRMLLAGLAAPSLLLKGIGYLLRLKKAGVPVISSSAVAAVSRDGGALKVRVAGWQADHHSVSLKADTVGIGFGFIPATELSRLLGCEHEIEDDGSLNIRRNDTLETSISDVFQVGDCAGLEGALSAIAQGEIAGATIVEKQTGRHVSSIKSRMGRFRHVMFQRHMWAAYDSPLPGIEFADEDTIICRCEDVCLGELRDLVTADTAPSNVKKATRCGMGECQGRYCGPVLWKLHAAAGCALGERQLHWAPRPPVRPVPMAALAKSFDGDL